MARRPPPPDLRPLDALGSIKIKLGVLVTGAVVAASLITWVGLANRLGPSRTLPLAVFGALIVTQVLAHGMTSPLREITAAVRAMAKGDYSVRVHASSRDEVGDLARAFNTMAADLARVDRARRDMIANVSHELRTPVAALQAELENMVDGVTYPTSETLQLALSQTERLSRLVIDLLDISRLEAGAVDLNISSIRLADFFAESLDAAAFVVSASGKKLAFHIQVSPEGLTVAADEERLHQVTANLLSNAIRHSPDGGTIALSAAAKGRRVVLQVADQGTGIPPDQRTRVFERFERADPAGQADSRGGAGTGLGLAIARWVVNLHGGTIEVADSSPGCTMRVTLPARVRERGRTPAADAPRQAKDRESGVA
ncbi:MAG: HAMP domain-containing protein [Bifidobacteriaceae bacterium]|jgi:signal transduction histidine kinase|nr:HAMP domain-containing protein [Bifidobacteriaceae bacterium]